MTELPYMPLYVDDYDGDTRHLSAEEDGCYGRLLRAMWRHGGTIPNDNRDLARICGINPRRWPFIKARLMPLLTVLQDTTLTQKRLYREYKNGLDILDANRRKTAAARAARHNKNNDIAVSDRAETEQHTEVVTEPTRARGTRTKEPTSPKGDVGSGTPLPPKAEPSPDRPVARSAREGGSRSLPPDAASLNGPFMPSRNQWDQPPSPGPRGQTEFLKRYRRYLEGDAHALDPLPGIPNGSSMSLKARNNIRAQLGLEPLEDEYAETQADEDDSGVVRNLQQPPRRSGPATDPDEQSHSDAAPSAAASEAGPADLGEQDDEGRGNPDTRPPDDDDDDPKHFLKF